MIAKRFFILALKDLAAVLVFLLSMANIESSIGFSWQFFDTFIHISITLKFGKGDKEFVARFGFV
jgi:hypothetical protein